MSRRRDSPYLVAAAIAIVLLAGVVVFLFAGGRTLIGGGGTGSTPNSTQGTTDSPSPGDSSTLSSPGSTQTLTPTDQGNELRVPQGILGARQADAEALLREQLESIPVKLTNAELPPGDSRDGTVVEVQPPENSLVTPGEDYILLTIGRAKIVTPPAQVRPGDLVITEIRVNRLEGASTCNLEIVAFNNLEQNVDGVTAQGEVEILYPGASSGGFEAFPQGTAERRSPNIFRAQFGTIWAAGANARVNVRLVHGPTVLDEVTNHIVQCP